MGMTLWIHTLEGRTLSKESEDHTALYDCAADLDAICRELGVTPLTAFFDMTDLEWNLAEDEDDLELPLEQSEIDPETGYAYGIDAMKWFDAAAGLATFEALKAHVAVVGLGAIAPSTTALLLADIEDCIAQLQGPAARGGQFNLPVVM